MRPTYLAVLAGLVVVSACDRAEKPKEATVAEAMPNLPIPPNAEFVSRSGGADALQLVFESSLRRDDVATYYRRIFTGAGWNLVSDVTQPDSTIALYAEQAGHPMWARITPTGTTTRIELMGAVPGADSAFAARARAAHDTTNTLKVIPR
jgi:hypothetical protein